MIGPSGPDDEMTNTATVAPRGEALEENFDEEEKRKKNPV